MDSDEGPSVPSPGRGSGADVLVVGLRCFEGQCRRLQDLAGAFRAVGHRLLFLVPAGLCPFLGGLGTSLHCGEAPGLSALACLHYPLIPTLICDPTPLLPPFPCLQSRACVALRV